MHSLIDVGGAGYYHNPYLVLNRLRAQAPVFWSPGLRRWVITRYDDAWTVLRDTTRFSSHVVPQIPLHERVPALADFVNLSAQWLFFLDPPAHGPQRAVVARHFTPQTAQTLAPLIRRTACELLSATSQMSHLKSPLDLIAGFAHPLAARVIAALLCDTEDETAEFSGWCRASENASRHARDPQARQAGFRAIAAATAYLRQRTQNRDNLPPLLRSVAQHAPAVDTDSLCAHGLVMMFAGVETTQNLIANLCHALLQHPAQWELLRHNPQLTERAVEEGLRYDAPVLGVVRRVRETVIMHGVTLAPGDEVVVMAGAANRDPQRFKAPDIFDLQRAESAHLAFGLGRHYCTGAALARLTARVALEVLLEKSGNFEMAETNPAWRDHDPIVRGLKRLLVRLS